MICAKTLPEWLSSVEQKWLFEAIDDGTKGDYREMYGKVKSGEWDVLALEPPAEGIAVSYAENGRLFIHYLHGKGLFDTLTLEDLLEVSRSQGLSGLTCETSKPGMVRLLTRIGWTVVSKSGPRYRMELDDEL